jgi:hypothetical protein
MSDIAQHNKIVDEAWAYARSEKGRLIASQQVLRLYEGRAWRATLLRVTVTLCITALAIAVVALLCRR